MNEILIESAYFVLNEPALALAGRLHDQGVRIRALTNSMASNDVLPNHASYAMVREKMLNHGSELYELRPDAPSCLQTVGRSELCDADKNPVKPTISTCHINSAKIKAIDFNGQRSST